MSWTPQSPHPLPLWMLRLAFCRLLRVLFSAFDLVDTQDVNTGRVLVLKRSSLQSHEGRVVYEKEASIMRSLAHPNIVQVGCT